MTPAMSRCNQGVSLSTNSPKKAAAVQEPPPLAFAMLFKSAALTFSENYHYEINSHI